jgi:glucose-6-phosphate isomerase
VTKGLHLSFDFSLVLESNLKSGDGMTAAAMKAALRRARQAAKVAEERNASGQIGFPDMPFRLVEAKAIARQAAALRRKNSHMLVLGIGGSALGTKAVIEGIGAKARKGMAVHVADNVDPDFFLPLLKSLPMKETVVVAISKSGTTAETNAQLALAMDALKKADPKGWRDRLVLVTDPEKGVFRKLANDEGLTAWEVPQNVGGRFSVFTPVGLLPLAAAGISVDRLLDGAAWMEAMFRGVPGDDNPVIKAAAVYAHYMVENPKAVQLWFTYGQGLDRVAEWWQQLWGESLGKKKPGGGAVGQTPARAVGVTDQHSQVQLYQDGPNDKIYTFVKWMEGREKGNVPKAAFSPDMAMLGGRPLRDLFEAEFEGTIGALWDAGRPIVRLELGGRDEGHLGAFLHFWMWVTAIVGDILGVDAFDQPGVEEGKKIARALMGEKGSEKRREAFNLKSEKRMRDEIHIEDRPAEDDED